MNASVKLNTPCELINVTPLNPLISKCQVKVCYVGDEPNRNGSVITKATALEMAKTLPGSPIVGFYNETSEDFEEHNRVIEVKNGCLKFKDTTKPYGFVDLGAQMWFQDYLDGDKVHTYLVTEGYLWTGQYPEAKRILDKGNNQSMELDESSLDGSWTYDDNSGMEFFIINDAIFSKLCILGENVEPCFEGAQITKFSLDDEFNNKIYALMKEVRKLKGGNFAMGDEKNLDEELEVIPEVEEEKEEDVKDPETEVPTADDSEAEAEENSADIDAEQEDEEPAAADDDGAESEAEAQPSEDSADEKEEEEENHEENKDEEVQFALSDFQSLQESFNTLTAQYNQLKTDFDTMKESYDALVEFKAEKDREAKQNMIDSFYMLGDEDKKDVQENIDKYSLDEIEAKLSIICVHNKLDMSGRSDVEDNKNTTFSLDEVDDDSEDANIPALVSALRKNRKNEN